MKTCDWEKPNSSKARKVVIPPLTIAGPIFKRLLTARSSRVPRKISILLKYSKSKYSHLFNKRGGWNKRGGGAKVAKSLNVEVGINVEGGIFWKKLVHNSNKRGVEGGKI